MPSSALAHSACIGLGSNLGDSRRLLVAAWQALDDHPAITTRLLSSPYRTAPVAMDSANWFVNAAGLLQTSLGPRDLLGVLQQVERRFGRQRSGRQGYQDRTLDLDLLLFGDHILDDPELVLPHPAMHRRAFVLVPLVEIAPDLVHPGLETTVRALLEQLPPGERQGPAIRPAQWPHDVAMPGNCLK